MYRRIVLKLSGEALAGGRGFGLDANKVAEITTEIAEVHSLGVEIAVVVGGGNIFRGVEGVYNADPVLYKDAVKYDEITYMDILRQGLKVMDLTAVSLCKDNNLPMIIFNMNQPGNIKRVVLGEKVGSLVTA